MTPLLELLHTAQGYGYLDEVGTIYGLMWNTPELLISATLRLLEADQEPYPFFAFKEGFEKIWSTIVETERLEVEYNTQIVNIARSHHGTYIHYTVGDGIYLKLDWCDFLIWTPPMTELLNVLSTAARSIAEIITSTGNINVDFEDVNTVMRNAGTAVIGSATASGENRANRAAELAINSPLLNNQEIYGAKKILLNIVSGEEDEINMNELKNITAVSYTHLTLPTNREV